MSNASEEKIKECHVDYHLCFKEANRRRKEKQEREQAEIVEGLERKFWPSLKNRIS